MVSRHRPLGNRQAAAVDVQLTQGQAGLTLSGLSRCACDLYYWSSSEVGLVRLHPSLCGTSSMMPQKRNPIALECIRALAGDAADWAASQLGLLHFAQLHGRRPGVRPQPPTGLLPRDRRSGGLADRGERHARDRRGSPRRLGSPQLVEHERLGRRPRRSAWSEPPGRAVHSLSYRAAHETVARLVTSHEDAGTGVRQPSCRAPSTKRRPSFSLTRVPSSTRIALKGPFRLVGGGYLVQG